MENNWEAEMVQELPARQYHSSDFNEVSCERFHSFGDSYVSHVVVETPNGIEMTCDEVKAIFEWRESCWHEHDCCGCTISCAVDWIAEHDHNYSKGKAFVMLLHYQRNL